MPYHPQYQHLIAPTKQGKLFADGWHAIDSGLLNSIPCDWQNWLIDEGSLTSKLTEFSDGRFRVRVLQETWQRPSRYEVLKLGLNQNHAVRVREVELLCNEEVVVYARTVIPLYLYLQEAAIFSKMGTRPLGHFLFREGQTKTLERDIKCQQMNSQQTLFARATPYHFRTNRILVSEYFVNSALVRK